MHLIVVGVFFEYVALGVKLIHMAVIYFKHRSQKKKDPEFKREIEAKDQFLEYLPLKE